MFEVLSGAVTFSLGSVGMAIYKTCLVGQTVVVVVVVVECGLVRKILSW